MANTRFQHKRSSVSGVVPTTSDIASGELGINLADRRLFTSNGTAVFELGANLSALAVGNSTVRQIVNTTGVFVNGNISLTRNDTRLTFTPTTGGANVYFVQQSDDNFVFYTTNTSGTPRPVFSVFANTNSPNQNSAFTFRGPVDFSTAGVYANNSLGSSGQVLTSNGSGVYWAAAAAAGVNTAAQYSWTNVHNFSSNVVLVGQANSLANASLTFFSNGAGRINFVQTGGNTTTSTTRTDTITPTSFSSYVITTDSITSSQISTLANLTTTSTGFFTDDGGGGGGTIVLTTTAAQANLYMSGLNSTVLNDDQLVVGFGQVTNTIVNATAVSTSNVIVRSTGRLTLAAGAGLSANGSLGSAGQVLTSNGSGVYWGTSAISQVVSEQFTANGTANSFTVTGGYIPSAIEVYVSGVKQIPGIDVLVGSGTTINFATPPLANQVVDVFGYRGASGITTGGTVTSVTFGNGLAGGSVTTVGTGSILANNGTTANSSGLFVVAGTGTVVNSTGVHVNSAFVSSIPSIVNTTGSFTISGINTYTANIVLGNTTVNTQLSNSTVLISNSTSTTSLGLTDLRLGNTTTNVVISNTVSSFSGNVGIGTASPAGRFNVAGGRGLFGPANEIFGVGIGWNQTRVSSGQIFYLGATDTTTPDLVFTNAIGSEAARITTGGVVQDSKGDVRTLVLNSQTTGYTLVAADHGRMIRITTGGVTIPANIFTVGQNITIYNNSGSSQTITASAVTCFLAGTATTGNRTLAQRGIATIVCVDTNTFVISGAGLA